jgi:hypothetical protein
MNSTRMSLGGILKVLVIERVDSNFVLSAIGVSLEYQIDKDGTRGDPIQTKFVDVVMNSCIR